MSRPMVMDFFGFGNKKGIKNKLNHMKKDFLRPIIGGNYPKITPFYLKGNKLNEGYPKRSISEMRLIDKKPYGDKDKDGLINFFDCKPKNKHKTSALMRADIAKTLHMKEKQNRREKGEMLISHFQRYGGDSESLYEKNTPKLRRELRGQLKEEGKIITTNKSIIRHYEKHPDQYTTLKETIEKGNLVKLEVPKSKNDDIHMKNSSALQGYYNPMNKKIRIKPIREVDYGEGEVVRVPISKLIAHEQHHSTQSHDRKMSEKLLKEARKEKIFDIDENAIITSVTKDPRKMERKEEIMNKLREINKYAEITTKAYERDFVERPERKYEIEGVKRVSHPEALQSLDIKSKTKKEKKEKDKKEIKENKDKNNNQIPDKFESTQTVEHDIMEEL